MVHDKLPRAEAAVRPIVYGHRDRAVAIGADERCGGHGDCSIGIRHLAEALSRNGQDSHLPTNRSCVPLAREATRVLAGQHSQGLSETAAGLRGVGYSWGFPLGFVGRPLAELFEPLADGDPNPFGSVAARIEGDDLIDDFAERRRNPNEESGLVAVAIRGAFASHSHILW